MADTSVPRSSQYGSSRALEKVPTGIAGFDEITGGGVPKGRTTLVCGSAGCGKTMFSMEFLIRGVTEFGDPGVCMTFEETSDDLVKNVRSLGFDLDQLIAEQKVLVDFVRIDRSEIDEAGEYNLDGLFITVDTLQPNTVSKLRDYAKQMTGNTDIQVAVTAVLNQWAQQSEPKGKR